jgi:hypothetical protein
MSRALRRLYHHRRMICLTKSVLHVLALTVACAMMAGCKSTETDIDVDGGTKLFGPRRVKVGETFEIRQPFDRETGSQWELASFDSRIVQLTTFSPVDVSDPNAMVRVMRFEGRSPGETEIVMLRRNREPLTPGMPPEPRERKSIKVRVVD